MKPEPIQRSQASCIATWRIRAAARMIAQWRGRIARARLASPIAIAAALCLSACASPWPKGAYAQLVLDRPLPANETQKREECAWIRNEIGWQHEAWARRMPFVEGRDAVLSRTTLEQNLIVLESRAKAAQCNE